MSKKLKESSPKKSIFFLQARVNKALAEEVNMHRRLSGQKWNQVVEQMMRNYLMEKRGSG